MHMSLQLQDGGVYDQLVAELTEAQATNDGGGEGKEAPPCSSSVNKKATSLHSTDDSIFLGL